ncbi:MAG: bifunctional glutamate N-acetyltransferase/amino-acid acetyltransferase ArgJ [Gemmatimonadetes bacterium]|nr:bifunctional glutamate N-acetyltransferase/amino-acid acetyltransferase ArgJ [Gemmatimonadota bacterium]
MNQDPFDAYPRLPRGFRCAAIHCGIKAQGRDLSLIASDVPGTAAAVFTRNLIPGAPIVVGRELLRAGRLQAVVVNSRVSNVGTGAEGIARARRMGAAAATALGVAPELVLMSSTGVIGVPLPVERIEGAMPALVAALQDDPLDAAEGIMTTDTHPKALSLAVGEAVLTVIAKGSGMIEPNMATMLCYVLTDAELDARELDGALRRVVDDTLNMVSIDTDTSTSDTCVVIANGRAGSVPVEAFEAALRAALTRMAETLARDGEGASRLVRATVRGAADRDQARRIAKSIVNSPLVKTMVYGGDPNVGRLLMAVGKCFDCQVDPGRLVAEITGVTVFRQGTRTDFDEAAVRTLLGEDPVDLLVDLGVGPGEALAWGCDLTPGYIAENAAYYSS